jgi:hypothetical protein
MEHFGSFGGLLLASPGREDGGGGGGGGGRERQDFGVGGGEGTVGVALTALHRDPGAFKSFCQLGRHLSEVSRLD